MNKSSVYSDAESDSECLNEGISMGLACSDLAHAVTEVSLTLDLESIVSSDGLTRVGDAVLV